MASNRNNEIRNYTRRNGEQVIELVTKREAFDAAFDWNYDSNGNRVWHTNESVYVWDINGKCYHSDFDAMPSKKDIVAIDCAEWGIVWVSNRASDKVVDDINAGYEVQIEYAIEDDENEAEMEAEKAAKEAEAEEAEEIEEIQAANKTEQENEVMAVIEALEAEIIAHQDAYQAGTPTISDAEYDALAQKLEAMKPESEALARIGKPEGKVEHKTPMLSLQKAYDRYDMQEWQAKLKSKASGFMASVKLDGIACSLQYTDGVLSMASTRGDGHMGEDITKGIMAAEAIPSKLEVPVTVEVRGELVLKKADYKRLGIKTAGRNAVAGSVNGKVTDITKALHFVAYDVVGLESETAKFEAIEGFKVFEIAPHISTDMDGMSKAITAMRKEAKRFGYDADGVVIKVDDAAEQAKLGATKHHPKGAIAFKFDTKAVETEVTAIEITVGKTGKETPIAIFKTVTLDGAKVSKASLGSIKTMEEMEIKVGSKVMVTRKGGTVPVIIGAN